MARFEFSLEAALEQRRRVERERQLVVAKLEQSRVQIETRVKGVQQRLTTERDELRALLSPGRRAGVDGVAKVSVASVRMQATAGLHGLSELRTLAIELAGVLKRLEGARSQLLAAAVARKAVEKLRERRFTEWKREQDHREAAELDDLTLMRAGAPALADAISETTV
ncbi:MAG: flagellar FliJ family protein [Phycisphaerales bacterium]